MDSIPLKIKLVQICTKNKLIIKVVEEYFNGLPHIKYTQRGLRKDCVYFILNYSIWNILRNMHKHLNRIHWGMCRFGTYTYFAKQYIYRIPPGAWDADELPPNVKIDFNLVDKLKAISEGYYD